MMSSRVVPSSLTLSSTPSAPSSPCGVDDYLVFILVLLPLMLYIIIASELKGIMVGREGAVKKKTEVGGRQEWSYIIYTFLETERKGGRGERIGRGEDRQGVSTCCMAICVRYSWSTLSIASFKSFLRPYNTPYTQTQ